jgi:hypothetical protein
MNLKLSTYIIISCVVILASCKKEAGEGGTSTITGRIIVHDYDAAFLNPTYVTYYPAGEDIFIIYGADHSTYDNDYKTTYNGTYEFKYLQKGKYRIFGYSTDSTGAYNGTFNANRPKIPVFKDVEITSNHSTVTVPDIIILKNKQ